MLCIFLFRRHTSDKIEAFKDDVYVDMWREMMTGFVQENK